MTDIIREDLYQELNPKALEEGIRMRDEEVMKRRLEESLDAWAYQVDGDDLHAAHCVHLKHGGRVCSRTYDPLPYKEALPSDLRMYAGTGIGALYGLSESEGHAWQLAGWNVATRRFG